LLDVSVGVRSIPSELVVTDLATANKEGVIWCDEVNARVHADICALPRERLEAERALLGPLPGLRAQIGRMVRRKFEHLRCLRSGWARYSVPTTHIGTTLELGCATAASRYSIWARSSRST
jgi:hypothetical protein